MAETTGLVQQLLWLEDLLTVYVRIGPEPNEFEQRAIFFWSTDPPYILANKRNMANVLGAAQRSGLVVTVVHDDSSDLVDAMQTRPLDITPQGPAVHGDVFSVAGAGSPADAHFLFEKHGRIAGIQPTVARPHVLVVDAMPAELPLGSNAVQVVGRGFSSDRVPVAVIDGPAPRPATRSRAISARSTGLTTPPTSTGPAAIRRTGPPTTPGAGRPSPTSWTATPRSTSSTASPGRGSRAAYAPRSTARSLRCSRCHRDCAAP
jgi:hypothetical protein